MVATPLDTACADPAIGTATRERPRAESPESRGKNGKVRRSLGFGRVRSRGRSSHKQRFERTGANGCERRSHLPCRRSWFESHHPLLNPRKWGFCCLLGQRKFPDESRNLDSKVRTHDRPLRYGRDVATASDLLRVRASAIRDRGLGRAKRELGGDLDVEARRSQSAVLEEYGSSSRRLTSCSAPSRPTGPRARGNERHDP
jgi:hypothetical protein